uniref:Uncharacterized protein n=1 Tax=Candidatus Kentrum sp. DK TaxID=2126562 RepID=A0A450RVV6_9GAMM|nr:MAG: hypothetical protein BECKDK2373B_GA0170837_10056 [Candidatus Kentron sp. DK]
MLSLYRYMSTGWTFKNLFVFLGFSFIILLSPAIASQPVVGSNSQCQDKQYANRCPETCAARCDNAESSADIAACIDVLRVVRGGARDHLSCRVSESAHSTETIPLDELRVRCATSDFARDCPETCDRLCTQNELDENQLKSCQNILKALTEGVKDRGSCRRQVSNYDSCKKKVATFFKDFEAPPPPEGPLETVYESRPDCATPLKKLLANFICLRDEAGNISDGLKELEDEELSGIDDIDTLCSLKKNDLRYFTGLSERLIEQGDKLKKEFKDLEGCRVNLIEWSEQLKAACSNSDLANCITIVDNLARARQPMMEKVGRLSSGMEQTLNKVEHELDNVRFFQSAALDCPPPGSGEEELTLDQILGSP